MKHTNSSPTCPSCENKLKGVYFALADAFRKVIKPSFHNCHISDGWRDEPDQNKAFEDGKSKVRWPNSPHNKVDDAGYPCSLAIDVFELGDNGVAYWRWKYFEDIAKQLEETGVPIIWGGNWKSIKDGPHFEWAGPV